MIGEGFARGGFGAETDVRVSVTLRLVGEGQQSSVLPVGCGDRAALPPITQAGHCSADPRGVSSLMLLDMAVILNLKPYPQGASFMLRREHLESLEKPRR